MLEVVAGEQLTTLAIRLADILTDPLADPMAPEWVVVPTAGVGRWLRLQLALRLGASGAGAGDGVAANIEMLYPGRFRHLVLRPDGRRDTDPWEVGRLTWAVLDVMSTQGADPRLGPAVQIAPGATMWARARRIADLFDRYLLHRPEMVRRWEQGRDVDAWASPLPLRVEWQPHLWRLVAARVGEQSPAVSVPALLDRLRRGHCPQEIPARVALFGLNSIPGGSPFVELLEALATQRDVHLLLHVPSIAMTRTVLPADGTPTWALRRRKNAGSVPEARHPLLRSWARPAREALELLSTTEPQVAPSTDVSEGPGPDTLLGRLQADFRGDRAPQGDLRPAADDTSVRIHSCHGASRQVEVLRDHILHLLAEDPELREDDVVVLCPSLEEYAPLIEARWGGSAVDGDTHGGPGAPTLAYRISDRSLATAVPLLAALASVIELLGSRFSDAAVLEVASLAPVRERYGFDDADISRLALWVEEANTRWGIDGHHRAAWCVPECLDDGTWSTALDRILLGVLIGDDPAALGPGGVAPIGVEGAAVSLAGRFADLLARLTHLAKEARQPRPVRGWVELLRAGASDLFATATNARWEEAKLATVLERIDVEAMLGDGSCDVDLTLAEVRALLGRHLQGTAGRADFFRGGVTVSSLAPLRGVPYRVVCLLGLDEAAFGASAPDGDDITAPAPAVGDTDRRAEARQALLDAVLCAGTHLVITRTGRSVVTNQPVPPAVAVAELRDAISATIDPETRREAMGRVEVAQPRQSYDERNFIPGAVDPSVAGPWSFDPVAFEGASHRQSSDRAPSLLAEPLEAEAPAVIELADLRDFLANPVKHFLRRRLDLALPKAPDRKGGKPVTASPGPAGVGRASEGRNLVLELDGLETWSVADRLLSFVRAGGDVDSFARREEASDLLPPGRLSADAIEKAKEKVAPLLACAEVLGVSNCEPTQVPVDVMLPDGIRVVGSVRDDGGCRPGPVTITVSKHERRRELTPWLDLLALVASDPSQPWQSALVTPKTRKCNNKAMSGHSLVRLELPEEPGSCRRGRAVAALSVVVDLYLRGRREPLPLFPKSSPLLAQDKNIRNAWSSDWAGSPGEGDDPWVQLAFGELTHRELLAIPCQPGDPDGSGAGRAERYAKILWGAVDASVATAAGGDPRGDTRP